MKTTSCLNRKVWKKCPTLRWWIFFTQRFIGGLTIPSDEHLPSSKPPNEFATENRPPTPQRKPYGLPVSPFQGGELAVSFRGIVLQKRLGFFWGTLAAPGHQAPKHCWNCIQIPTSFWKWGIFLYPRISVFSWNASYLYSCLQPPFFKVKYTPACEINVQMSIFFAHFPT